MGRVEAVHVLCEPQCVELLRVVGALYQPPTPPPPANNKNSDEPADASNEAADSNARASNDVAIADVVRVLRQEAQEQNISEEALVRYALASFDVFLQENWTGPPIDRSTFPFHDLMKESQSETLVVRQPQVSETPSQIIEGTDKRNHATKRVASATGEDSAMHHPHDDDAAVDDDDDDDDAGEAAVEEDAIHIAARRGDQSTLLHRGVVQTLTVDGEVPYRWIRCPILLVFPLAVFENASDRLPATPLGVLFEFRTLCAHQQLLDTITGRLHDKITALSAQLAPLCAQLAQENPTDQGGTLGQGDTTSPGDGDDDDDEDDDAGHVADRHRDRGGDENTENPPIPLARKIAAQIYAERAHAHLTFHEGKIAKFLIRRGLMASGVRVFLVGKLGKRTKFQYKSLAQMTVAVAPWPAGAEGDILVDFGEENDEENNPLRRSVLLDFYRRSAHAVEAEEEEEEGTSQPVTSTAPVNKNASLATATTQTRGTTSSNATGPSARAAPSDYFIEQERAEHEDELARYDIDRSHYRVSGAYVTVPSPPNAGRGEGDAAEVKSGLGDKNSSKPCCRFSTEALVAQYINIDQAEAQVHSNLPKEVELDDDTLLSSIHFEEDASGHTLPDVSEEVQSLILAKIRYKLTSIAKNELQEEELVPYADIVLSSRKAYAIQKYALLIKTRLEKGHTRKLQRSTQQLAEIAEYYSCVDGCASHMRLPFLFAVQLPPFWEVQNELAQRYISLGLSRDALVIYSSLEIWEGVIAAHQLLGEEETAEKIVRARLKIDPEDASLWCALGEITKNEADFYKAFEVSNSRMAKPMRVLGIMLLNQAEHARTSRDELLEEKYTHAIECLQKSLRLNAFQPGLWFSLGCCAMRINNHELSTAAFRRKLEIEDNDFESWNNLANGYMRLGQRKRAFFAFQQATKHAFDNWKVWENYGVVAVSVNKTNECIQSINQILHTKGAYNDWKVLAALTHTLLHPAEVAEQSRKINRKGEFAYAHPGDGDVDGDGDDAVSSAEDEFILPPPSLPETVPDQVSENPSDTPPVTADLSPVEGEEEGSNHDDVNSDGNDDDASAARLKEVFDFSPTQRFIDQQRQKLAETLSKMKEASVSNFRVWMVAARFLNAIGESVEARACRRLAYQLVKGVENWEKSDEGSQHVVDCLDDMVTAASDGDEGETENEYRRTNFRKQYNSIKLMLKGVVKTLAGVVARGDASEGVQEQATRAEQLLEKLMTLINQ